MTVSPKPAHLNYSGRAEQVHNSDMARKFFNIRWVVLRACGVICLLMFSMGAPAQQLAKRLILKDGSYQLVTKWELKGQRVRYLSAERNDWEELPSELVDWTATETFEKNRAEGAPPPEVTDLDKQAAAERAAEEARTPEVAPGLRLLDPNSVMLLDTFHNQPQLVPLQQSSSEVNANRKGNILRGVINPISGSRQSIEVPNSHASVQAHATLPAIYINVEAQDDANVPEHPVTELPQLPWDRFKIVRAQVKRDKRIVGAVKTSVVGKSSQEQNLVPSTAEKLTGGWIKITPTAPIASGEYAVVEMLGKEGMNLYVWDFGVNPSAPANVNAQNPERTGAQSPKQNAFPKRQ